MALNRVHIGLAGCTLLILAVGLYVSSPMPPRLVPLQGVEDSPVPARVAEGPPVAPPEPPSNRLSYVGHLMPIRVALVKANTTGRVVNVHVQKADRVRKGDRLADFDDRMSGAELELARAKLGAAESRYRRILSAPDPESDPAEVKTKHRLAEAEVHAARAECSSAEHRLADTRIHAPFDGTIMEVFIGKDDTVDASDQRKSKLFELADLGGFLAEVAAPQKDWGHLQKGQAARIGVPSHPGVHLEGEVLEIDPRIDPKTGCFAARIKIKSSEDVKFLMSGMFVVVSLAGKNIP